MSLNYVQLQIVQQDAGQDAGSGAVTITPTSKVTAAGITVVSQVPLVRQLSSGTLTVQLVASDNSGTVPASGFWAYNIQLPNETVPTPYLVNFSGGASQRLDSLTPVVASTTYGPAATAGVTSFNTRSGAVTPASGDYTAAQVGALAAAASSTSVPAAALTPKVVTLTDGSSVPLNAAAGNVFDWPLGGSSHTLAAPTGLVDGEVFTVRVKYGGSFTPLFAAIYDFGAAGAPSWTATSGKSDHVAFAYDAAANSGAGGCRCLGGGLGYTS